MVRKIAKEEAGLASAEVRAGDVLSGTELSAVAYHIDNGYILRLANGGALQARLVYCRNEQEIAEQMIAHRAKAKLNGEKTSRNYPHIYAGAATSKSI